jgi:fumarate hydratase subunit alpha
MAIREGVVEATRSVPLRPNAVHPLTRKNPGTNIGQLMPYVHCRFSKEDYMEITVMPKGAGAENMNALAMLTPSQGLRGIKEFVLNAVVKAGGNSCPPGVLGIGIGGSTDIAVELSKEALLRPLNTRNSDPDVAMLEKELHEAINELRIGPMGLGGKTTVLGVNAEYAYCHTASLPVALSFQCWASRRATVRIYADGVVDHVSQGKRTVSR